MSVHETEYSKIHEQRMSLVENNSSFTRNSINISIILFSATIVASIQFGEHSYLAIIGLIGSIVILIHSFIRAVEVDRSIRKLYPRIISIELHLGMNFYRDYLRAKGGEEKVFVERCEAIQDKTNLDKLHKEVIKYSKDVVFVPWKRGFKRELYGVLIYSLIYISVTLVRFYYPN